MYISQTVSKCLLATICFSTMVKAAGWSAGTVLLTGSDSSANPTAMYYDSTTGNTSALQVDGLVVLSNQVAVLVGTKAYYIGGTSTAGGTTTVFNGLQSLDVTTGVVANLTSMITPRANHAGIKLDTDRILVCGGLTSAQETTNTCEIYSIADNKWTPAANMSKALYGIKFVLPGWTDAPVIGIGGATDWTQTSSSSAMYAYYASNNTWSTLAVTVPNTPTFKAGLLGHDVVMVPATQNLLTCGGQTGVNMAEGSEFTSACYVIAIPSIPIPTTGTNDGWKQSSNIRVALSNIAMTNIGTVPFIFGGNNDSSTYPPQTLVQNYKHEWLNPKTGNLTSPIMAATTIVVPAGATF